MLEDRTNTKVCSCGINHTDLCGLHSVFEEVNMLYIYSNYWCCDATQWKMFTLQSLDMYTVQTQHISCLTSSAALMFIQYMPGILNLMPATHFKQVGTGATKGWESCGMLQETPVWNSPQVQAHWFIYILHSFSSFLVFIVTILASTFLSGSDRK